LGGAVGPTLAAAVSNAGGLGILVPWWADLDTVRRETRGLTRRPFGVNLNLELPQEERLAVCLEEGVPVISFFWRDPSPFVPRAKAGGATVLHSVGSVLTIRFLVLTLTVATRYLGYIAQASAGVVTSALLTWLEGAQHGDWDR
jgi:NAD(P)H-dependent flavin oxidoreductase YrpB (nitropropane dioxygenase family)